MYEIENIKLHSRINENVKQTNNLKYFKTVGLLELTHKQDPFMV